MADNTMYTTIMAPALREALGVEERAFHVVTPGLVGIPRVPRNGAILRDDIESFLAGRTKPKTGSAG